MTTAKPLARYSAMGGALASGLATRRYTITRGATPDNGLADVPNIAGGIPPAFLNHRAPTA